MISVSFRCHSFKKRIEKTDEQLKLYIKSLTVIVEEPMQRPVQESLRVPEIKQHQHHHQQPIQEIQIQRPPETHPLIINMANVPSMINQNQLFQTSNGQICQLIQGPNNTIQSIQVLAPPQQIIQPSEVTTMLQPAENFFEEIPVVVQSSNGHQTILNLPHHQVQALQQQIQMAGNQQQQHHHQEIEIVQEADEIGMQEYEDFTCEEEEVMEEEQDESATATTTYTIVQTIQEGQDSENSDSDDKQLLAEFLAQQTHSEPGRHVCLLCSQEFKHQKWLHSHMKSIHINWIKANCKKQPQCTKCGKSFRGPGMLKMHMKTHEKENKLPSCSVCQKGKNLRKYDDYVTIKIFVCAEFKSKSILYRHRATHFSNQKQHRCEICDKNFSSNYQLNAHHRTRHEAKSETKVKIDVC